MNILDAWLESLATIGPAIESEAVALTLPRGWQEAREILRDHSHFSHSRTEDLKARLVLACTEYSYDLQTARSANNVFQLTAGAPFRKFPVEDPARFFRTMAEVLSPKTEQEVRVAANTDLRSARIVAYKSSTIENAGWECATRLICEGFAEAAYGLLPALASYLQMDVTPLIGSRSVRPILSVNGSDLLEVSLSKTKRSAGRLLS